MDVCNQSTAEQCYRSSFVHFSKAGLGQTFFILWFTDIFAPYPMSGFGIKIKINFSDIRLTLVTKQERAYPFPHKGINYSE